MVVAEEEDTPLVEVVTGDDAGITPSLFTAPLAALVDPVDAVVPVEGTCDD